MPNLNQLLKEHAEFQSFMDADSAMEGVVLSSAWIQFLQLYSMVISCDSISDAGARALIQAIDDVADKYLAANGGQAETQTAEQSFEPDVVPANVPAGQPDDYRAASQPAYDLDRIKSLANYAY